MMMSSLRRLTEGGFSIGVELPLDNDWSPTGERRRQEDGRPFGVPAIKRHGELVRLTDRLGFRALWLRDVPVYDPGFGDAAQVFEVFTYLGYLAGVTDRILLGTAAVVLPLREPVLTLKAAASVEHISQGRLLLGVASGDRPVEYPLFGRDFEARGDRFRQQVEMLRQWHGTDWPEGIEILPRPSHELPLLVAGLAQQRPEWIGTHMDGWLAYPGTPEDHAKRVAVWHQVAGSKPYVSFIHLNLAEHPDAPMQRHRFGGRVGRNGLITELEALRETGIQHIGLQFRRNERPLDETLHELAEFVLPRFHSHVDAQAVPGGWQEQAVE
ncbi:TIGR03571 family LLM class oxidoreductase [Xanthomonas hortorum]|uniref:Luciferase-like domain-containing protein n=2 Tax=Xanthomonas hortorum TaxID=56454 RepID=A0A6V7DFJ3_9XANT|nr:TIGR03571 family LLM class oxidoreductase [Xanthomonas hortorum]MCC8498179.1 TIGR03571 family LLM class oxidoreductase [Xanthomonas hortorum pv. gardneri]MCC8506587.1 TIGR03571 family LLM class oxidoreductase [Xanthomonas hortorum pv. gardneri]MCC8518830.1 TIGR03571 family LLM class oxidoreductase [Xanthomonas hortorum pv. gardneri]MCC8523562.1 TIGR03571 family LLM class oxidoreductase [Xanthomonas hortorum pv. gardneri]MCC8652098.1 TIGR03571 family LLM class oxidoreductase [Xanthomonas hor